MGTTTTRTVVATLVTTVVGTFVTTVVGTLATTVVGTLATIVGRTIVPRTAASSRRTIASRTRATLVVRLHIGAVVVASPCLVCSFSSSSFGCVVSFVLGVLRILAVAVTTTIARSFGMGDRGDLSLAAVALFVCAW